MSIHILLSKYHSHLLIHPYVLPVLLTAICLFGCGNDRSDEPEADKYGGTVVIGNFTKPSKLNPAISSSTVSVTIYGFIFDHLTELSNEDFTSNPSLAEDWAISEDNLTYTFYLRRDVKFHDGVPLTAEDIKFSFDLMPMETVKAVEVIDLYTIRFVLDQVNPRFLGNTAVMSILPKHILDGVDDLSNHAFSTQPIGSGLFKFEAWMDDSTSILLTANEDYHGGRAYIDSVIFRTGVNQSDLWALLMREEIDIMPDLTAEDMEIIEADSTTFKLHSTLVGFYYFLLYDLTNPLFADVRIRHAFSYALDKQRIIDDGLQGHGIIATGPFRPDSWAIDPDVQPFPYDPRKARRLFKEAGWADSNGDGLLDKNGKSFEVSLLINKRDKSKEAAALVIYQQLQEVGIHVNLERMDFQRILDERIKPRTFDMMLLQFNNVGDPDTARKFWYSKQTGRSWINWSRYSNTEVDRLFDQGQRTLDLPERQRIYQRIHRIMAEEQPVTFLYIPSQFQALNQRINGVKTSENESIYSSVSKWYLTP